MGFSLTRSFLIGRFRPISVVVFPAFSRKKNGHFSQKRRKRKRKLDREAPNEKQEVEEDAFAQERDKLLKLKRKNQWTWFLKKQRQYLNKKKSSRKEKSSVHLNPLHHANQKRQPNEEKANDLPVSNLAYYESSVRRRRSSKRNCDRPIETSTVSSVGEKETTRN